MTNFTKLLTLIAAANKCLPIAQADTIKPPHRQDLFASAEGRALVLAAHDLFEVDELFDFAADIAREIEPINDCACEIPDLPRVTTPVRKLDPAIWGKDAA